MPEFLKTPVRFLYRIFPMKAAVFSLVRKALPLPHSVFKHLHFVGEFAVPLEGREFRLMHHGFEIENEIFWKGLTSGWEGGSMRLWIQLCKESMFIVDVGANTGIYALVAKTLNPKAKVLAFEPVKRVYEKLVDNCRRNAFEIACFQTALSNFDGEGVIYDPQTAHLSSVTLNENLNPTADCIPVKTRVQRLASVLDGLEPGAKIDLLKIDVETHEVEVLEGLGERLRSQKPSMLIEILNDSVAARLECLLEGLGYLYFNLDDVSEPVRQDHLSRSLHFNFLVCQPDVARRLHLA